MSVKTPEEYRERIVSLDGLPSLPSVAAEILALRREDKLSISQMLPTIEKDPPLALKILKMANSAYYARRYKIDNLKQAIITIGLNDLTYLVLSFSIIKSFIIEGDETYWINWSDFWRHSVATAHISQSLVKTWNLQLITNPYAMGLLHDVGKLVMFKLDPALFMDTIKHIEENNVSSVEAESVIFGITHEQAGQWLSEKWMMPDSIQASVAYHHDAAKCSDSDMRNLVALIQVSEILCNTYQPNIVDLSTNDSLESLGGWDILKSHLDNERPSSKTEIWNLVSDEVANIDSVLSVLHGN
ncbi:MAG: HDOD domain-containing protein [FCB group bacterium]|nr:HDOD domain-containing protein [FCB group bacterium]